MRSLLVLLLLFYGVVTAAPPVFAHGGAVVQMRGSEDHEDEHEGRHGDGEEMHPPGGGGAPPGGEETPPGGGGQPPGGGGAPSPPGEEGHREGEGEHEYDEHYAFYGQIRLAGERVVAGSRQLMGTDPLLPYLAPGMWVEAEGRVDRRGLWVQKLRVLNPGVWAYYQGPGRAVGASGRVRAWFTDRDPRPYRLQTLGSGDDPEVVIVACFAWGRWQALPPSLTPAFKASEPGWWRLVGAYYSYGLRIESAERLEACSP